MRLAEKFRILASRYLILQAVWVVYTFVWLAAGQNPPYDINAFLTVSGVIVLLGLLNTSTMLIYHWRNR